eukprot:5703394-Prymnesium_polylepis.1
MAARVDVLAANIEMEATDILDRLSSTKRVRRPWCWFIGASVLLVLLFVAGGPVMNATHMTSRPAARPAAVEATSEFSPPQTARPPPPPPPPPPPLQKDDAAAEPAS